MKLPVLTLAVACLIVSAQAQAQTPPQYSAKVPPSITTPNTVETRIGTLKFLDGLPDADTVKKAYDQVDFSRGIEAFLSGIPAASVHALCTGFENIGMREMVPSVSPKI